jgi:natural product biosynthesis luciferase-like monooxygenase protein/amino acid adenylation domain-containing protein
VKHYPIIAFAYVFMQFEYMDSVTFYDADEKKIYTVSRNDLTCLETPTAEPHFYRLNQADDITQAMPFVFITGVKNDITVESHTSAWPNWRSAQLLSSVKHLLSELEKNATQPLLQISLCTSAQLAWLEQWNHTEKNWPDIQTLGHHFFKTAARFPTHVAITTTNTTITYAELKLSVEQAMFTLHAQGVRAGDGVAVMADRSAQSIIAIIAILCLGGFYLPIDSATPLKRQQAILHDAKITQCITPSLTVRTHPDAAQTPPPPVAMHPQDNLDDLAYVIYTSGSTGAPKGVAESQRAVLNTLYAMQERLQLTENDSVLALSKLTFDLSVFDVFSMLLCGGTIVLMDQDHEKNPEHWHDLILRHQISIWDSVPALMQMYLDYVSITDGDTQHSSLRHCILSGDFTPATLPNLIKNHINKNTHIHIQGGSTEAAIWSNAFLADTWDASAPLPYGAPLANQSLSIVNANGRLLPPGAKGEIVLGGSGVADCYWNNMALTRDRFRQVAHVGRAFFTRDLGMIDDEIEQAYIYGRLDRQAKVKGSRVDLSEVEAIALEITGLDRAVALSHTSEHHLTHLVLFYCGDETLTAQTIQDYLRQTLPEKSRPQKVIKIDSLPLTNNGKTDTKALLKILDRKKALLFGKKALYEGCVFATIEQQAYKTPHAIALIIDDKAITYNALLTKVTTFSQALQHTQIKTPVAISLQKNETLIITLLSCLKLSIPFIPLLPDWPKAWVNERLDACGASYIINERVYTELSTMDITKAPGANTISHLAYIIFTSGSSGSPKAVNVSKKALYSQLMAINDTLHITHDDRWLSLTPVNFDIFYLEALLPLMQGGQLILSDHAHNIHRPTVIQTTPSRWPSILENTDMLASARILITGGERLTESVKAQLVGLKKTVFNFYGPTEATLWSTVAHIDKETQTNIGTPLNNTEIAIVDKAHQLLHEGNDGEILISGQGLAEGYISTAQTDLSFIDITIDNKNTRYYKTGDRGKIVNGTLYFKGRLDRQCKIRGRRLDPVNIEKILVQSHDIAQCLITPINNNTQLGALVTTPKKQIPPMRISLYCFPDSKEQTPHDIPFYVDLAVRSEALGLYGFWIPERHFDRVGGSFSAPEIIAAAIASQTKHIKISAGSIVLPLHQTIRVAEQWASLDQLSQGRTRMALASGWHPNDFMLNPDNFKERKTTLLEQTTLLQSIWRDGHLSGKNGADKEISINVFPRPTQKSAPIWLTIAEDEAMFIEAGQRGYHILTHLLMQTTDALSQKIALYHHHLARAGFNPDDFNVTLMAHTFVTDSKSDIETKILPSLVRYFRSHLYLVAKLQGEKNSDALTHMPDTYFIALARRFINTKSLIGSPKTCQSFIQKLHNIGITEVAALVDFGIDTDLIHASLNTLASFKNTLEPYMAERPLNETQLRTTLSQIMPSEWIPDVFKSVHTLPITGNGKRDLSKAQALLEDITTHQTLIQKPVFSDPTENKLYEIWTHIFKVDTINTQKSFFQMGGHSLKAIALLDRVNHEFSCQILISDFLMDPYFTSMLTHIMTGVHLPPQKTIAINEQQVSISQKGIWVFSQFYPEAQCYNDAFLFSIAHGVDITHLQKCLTQLFNQYSVFHSGFIEKNGHLFRNAPARTVDIVNKTIEPYTPARIREHAAITFNLLHGPLASTKVLKEGSQYYLHLVMHHITTDGRSLISLMNQLTCLLNGHGDTPIIEPSFEFASRMAAFRSQDGYEERVNHYIKTLGLEQNKTLLSIGTYDLQDASFGGCMQLWDLSVEHTNMIKTHSDNLKTTPQDILLYAYVKTVMTFCEQPCLQLGIPMSLRPENQADDIDLFINFGLIKLVKDTFMSSPITTAVKDLRKKLAFMLDHRHIGYSDIVQTFNANLAQDIQPLFQVVFNPVDTTGDYQEYFSIIPKDYGIARFDLECQAIKNGDSHQIQMIFNEKIFSQTAQHQFMTMFKHQIDSLTASAQDAKHWEHIFNKLYDSTTLDEKNNWSGWSEYFSNTKIPDGIMTEWLKDTVKKLHHYPLGAVLDIGCGTGNIYNAVKQDSLYYCGIDFSKSIIQSLTEKNTRAQAEFHSLAAIDIDQLSPQLFDTVIINSIVQYFPNSHYFNAVLTKALDRLNPAGGHLFIGDIRHTDWQHHLYQESAATQKIPTQDIADIDAELLLRPQDVLNLLSQHSSKMTCLLEPKCFTTPHALSKYRYDISLYVYPAPKSPPLESVNIVRLPMSGSIEALTERIAMHKNTHTPQLLTGIYNAHVNDKGLYPGDIKRHCIETDLQHLLIHPYNADELMIYIGDAQHLTPALYVSLKPNTVITAKETLSKIWSDVLSTDGDFTQSDFFELGADSLSFIKLFSALKEIGASTTLRELYQATRFEDQVALLEMNTIEYSETH